MANLLIYAFTAGTANPTTTAAGLSGGACTNGSLYSFTANGDEGFASKPNIVAAPPASTTTAALAVTNNSYWYFTATPDAGKKLNFATLTLNAARGGSSTPRGIKIRSSVDSYVADLFSAALLTAPSTWTAINIDLTGASFQGLTAAITFRFYIWAPTTSNTVDADDITLTGTVADAAATVSPNFIPFFWA
jgi:hypothetical protein